MSARSVITIGNFDGVHLGHRGIVSRARQEADRLGARVLAVSFTRHPITVLRPGAAPLKLLDAADKHRLLLDAGADEVVMLDPTPELLAQTPQEFVAGMAAHHSPVLFVEGEDFRFGKDRAGDLDLLASLGASHGFEVVRIAHIETRLHDMLMVRVNSSLVRWLLAQGRVADAAACLGRPYTLKGTVCQGEKRGRTIGVPTANLDTAEFADRVIPAHGVYAGLAVLADGSRFRAAISIGAKPTFGAAAHAIEAHLLQFTGDLYGQRVELLFNRWLRHQQPFAGVEDLRRQLTRDIADAGGLMNSYDVSPSHSQTQSNRESA